jgi:short-subunit dehydrogenase
MNALNGEGNSHGVMDHNQETGMSAEECVRQMYVGVAKHKKEILIGNKEIMAVKIKRFFPRLFWKIIKKQSAT